jgi:hypothetical protein
MTCPYHPECPHCRVPLELTTDKYRKALRLLFRLTGATRTTAEGKRLRKLYREWPKSVVYATLNVQHLYRWNPYAGKWVNRADHAQLWKKAVDG